MARIIRPMSAYRKLSFNRRSLGEEGQGDVLSRSAHLDFFPPRTEVILFLLCFIFRGWEAGKRWGKFRYKMEMLLEFRN